MKNQLFPFRNIQVNSFFDFLVSKRFLYLISAISVIGFLITLKNRYIYIDDAWFGEQAFWFSKDGIPRTASLKDFFEWDKHLLVYHKLNIILGAGIIKVFGWSVNNLRITTIIIFSIFLCIFYRYHRANGEKLHSRDFSLLLFFFLVNPILISLVFTYRPEILVMLFGFLSWINLEVFLDNKKTWRLALAGIFSGLAFLTHMNGLIFSIAGVILLLYNRKFMPFLLFSIVTGAIASLFFYDLWQPGRLEMFLFQMREWPDPVGSNWISNNAFGYVWNVLRKLSSEHQRFFWSYKVWMSSVFFFLALIPFFRSQFKENKNLLIYTISLVIALNVFGSQIAERFLIYLFPYMALIFLFGIEKLRQKKYPVLKVLFSMAILLQIAFSTAMVVTILSKNKDFVQMHTQALSKIPPQSGIVLADYPFVFNGLETHDLISFKLFEYLEVSEKMKYNLETFTDKANSLGVKYIIFPEGKEQFENRDYSYLFDNVADIPHYELFLVSDGYKFYRSISLNDKPN
ncbi:MAG: hypothetical protein HOO86_08285 [Bacteroidales bacterium]|nr:hypothetical protein [Bacteroidales bacterium]